VAGHDARVVAVSTRTTCSPGAWPPTRCRPIPSASSSSPETNRTRRSKFRLANVGGYLLVGHLAQRFGRRPFLIAWGLNAAVVGTIVYAVLIATKPSALVVVIVLSAAVVVLVNPCWAMITAYINERFRTRERASGFGLGYSLAVVIPSFYAFYESVPGKLMNPDYTVLVLLVIGGLLITIGGAMGPETREVDMGEVRPRRRRPSASRASRASASAISRRRGRRAWVSARAPRRRSRPGSARPRSPGRAAARPPRRARPRSARPR
jgi:MFS family permease